MKSTSPKALAATLATRLPAERAAIGALATSTQGGPGRDPRPHLESPWWLAVARGDQATMAAELRARPALRRRVLEYLGISECDKDSTK